MTFVWLPVSSGWRYDDTVLMNRYIQGDSLYIPERFGVEGELYVCNWSYEDCFTAKDLNWPHHHGQQVWRRRKLLSDFHLLEVEVDTVRGSEIFRYGGQNLNGQASIDAETYSEEHPLHSCAVWFTWEIVCWSYKDLMVLNEGKKWFPPSRPPGMT